MICHVQAWTQQLTSYPKIFIHTNNKSKKNASYFHMTDRRDGHIFKTYIIKHIYFVCLRKGKSMYKDVTVLFSSLSPHHRPSLCLTSPFSDFFHCHKFQQCTCWAPGNERLCHKVKAASDPEAGLRWSSGSHTHMQTWTQTNMCTLVTVINVSECVLVWVCDASCQKGDH